MDGLRVRYPGLTRDSKVKGAVASGVCRGLVSLRRNMAQVGTAPDPTGRL